MPTPFKHSWSNFQIGVITYRLKNLFLNNDQFYFFINKSRMLQYCIDWNKKPKQNKKSNIEKTTKKENTKSNKNDNGTRIIHNIFFYHIKHCVCPKYTIVSDVSPLLVHLSQRLKWDNDIWRKSPYFQIPLVFCRRKFILSILASWIENFEHITLFDNTWM